MDGAYLTEGEAGGAVGSVVAFRDPGAFDQLRGDFDRIHGRDPHAGFFTRADWLAEIGLEKPGVTLLLGWRRDPEAKRFDAFLPLARQLHWSRSRGCFVTHLTGLGRLGLSDRAGFLCAPEDENAAMAGFAGWLSAAPWARFSLRHEPGLDRLQRFADSFDAQRFRLRWPEYRVNGGRTNQLLALSMPVPPDLDSYLSGLGRSTRKNLRRDLRAAAAAGIETRQITAPEEREQVRRALLQMWARKWAGAKSGKKLDVLATGYAAFLKRADRVGSLHLVASFEGDRMIGAMAHVVDAPSGRMISVIEGRAEGETRFSCGMVLVMSALQDAKQLGLTVYDFGYGDADYKYHLGGQDQRLGYLTLERRSGGAIRLFDPEQMSMALRAVDGFLARDRVKDARKALRALERNTRF